MASTQHSTTSSRVRRDSLLAGGLLAGFWALHASLAALPGRAYFFATKLNDSSAAVGPNVLLHPAFLAALAFIGLRGASFWRGAGAKRKYGLGIALACWGISATLSTVANAGTELVVLTYCTVFLAGGAVYLALDGMTLDSRAFELGVAGLAIGSLFPLIAGIVAFLQEWGALDLDTVLGAYKNLLRMELYEAATFGSRSNTASFVVIVVPIFLWVALDKSRSTAIRLLSAFMMVPLAANLMILEIRAAFLTCFFSVATVFGFKLGVRRYPLFAAGVALSLVCLSSYLPDMVNTMSERLRPVVMVDTAEDVSVSERVDAINEGWMLGEKHWMLGIGPGGGLTLHSLTSAHQFNVQQFMEEGTLGLLASAAFSVSVLLFFLQTLAGGRDGGINSMRFALLVGPAAFVVYGIFSNPTLAIGYVNTWPVLVASMLALAPGFDRVPARRALPARQPRPAIVPQESLSRG